jgi:hypothetical protein
VFDPHNLTSVAISYGNQNFFLNTPNIGTFNKNTQEMKTYLDYLTDPPFGMRVDPDLVTLARLNDGCKETVLPNVLLKMSNYKDKSRIVPFLNDGGKQDERKDLELDFTFGTGGATAGVTYCIYLYYCETNLILNTKKKSLPFWHSPFVTLI